MINSNLFMYFVFFVNIFLSSPAFSRCAVCVVSGMSGGSIALLVIISVFILLFIANWGLKKILDRSKYQ